MGHGAPPCVDLVQGEAAEERDRYHTCSDVWVVWNMCFFLGDGLWFVEHILLQFTKVFEGNNVFYTTDLIEIVLIWVGAVGLVLMQVLGNASSRSVRKHLFELWYK